MLEKQVISNLLALCERQHVLRIHSSNRNSSRADLIYGPLGYHLKRNLLSEWWRTFVTRGEYMLYPVSSPASSLTSTSSLSTQTDISGPLFSSTLKHFPSAWDLSGAKLPFGIVQIGSCFRSWIQRKPKGGEANSQSKNADLPYTNLWTPTELTEIALLFFCSPKKAPYFYDYWQRQQYLWWRRVAGDMSKFSMSEVTKTESGHQMVQMQFKSPWGMQCIGATCNRGSRPFEDDAKNMPGISNYKDVTYPAVIESTVYLDLGVLAYLCDAFQTRTKSNSSKVFLRMHHKLAPYKVAAVLTTSCNSSAPPTGLVELAEYLQRELKNANVPVYLNPDLASLNSLEMQFQRFDEMGIPYTVILSNDTTSKGIAGLRNRDTTLQEDVHFAELKTTLLKYLQMASHQET